MKFITVLLTTLMLSVGTANKAFASTSLKVCSKSSNGSVNIRYGPGLDYGIVNKAYNGQLLEYSYEGMQSNPNAKPPKDKHGYYWVKVGFNRSTDAGYIRADFLGCGFSSLQNSFNNEFSSSSKFGTIKGEIFYPSEYTPSQKICAQNITNKQNYCTKILETQNYYELQLPSGNYWIYSLTCNNTYARITYCKDKYSHSQGYYSDRSRCRIARNCSQNTSHNPIPVRVESGQNITKINISY